MAKIELCKECQEHVKHNRRTMLCRECDEKTRAQHTVMAEYVKEEEEKKYYYFTFGYGNPNEGLAQIVEAKDIAEAREIMSETYGNRWAFCYSAKQWKDFIMSGLPMEELMPCILRREKDPEVRELMPYILAPNVQLDIPKREEMIVYCVIDPDYETEKIVKMFCTRERAEEYIKSVFNSKLEIKEREVY